MQRQISSREGLANIKDTEKTDRLSWESLQKFSIEINALRRQRYQIYLIYL